MNKDIKELKEKVNNIEKMLKGERCCFRYPLSNLIDCKIDFGLKLRPLYPTTASEAIRLQQTETVLMANIRQDIKSMEDKINHYIRYNGI